MSLKIAGNNIVFTRKDTLYIKVVLEYSSGGTYELEEGDAVQFGIMSYNGTKVYVQKNVDTSTMLLKLKPSDTEQLSLDTIYQHGVKVIKANGDTFTVVFGTLKLIQEVC